MRETVGQPRFLQLFWGAVAAFVLAALAGAAFRGTIAWGWDTGLSLTNLRHAHSHLMYFGWVTPAIMALIAVRLPALTGRATPRGFPYVIGATLALGLASFPLFARFGYESISIGAARMPPSVIVAGLNMIAWYAFATLYARATWGARRGAALFSIDLALAMLVLSSLPAWSLAGVRPIGLDPAQWTPILAHAFLDTFSEGFLVLAILGLLHAERPRSTRRIALIAIATAAPLGFPMALPIGAMPTALRVVSAGAAIVWSVALLAELALFARDARDLRIGVPLACGAIAAIARFGSGVAPGIDWSEYLGLRLLYLHLLLLGMISLALFGLARAALGERAVPRLGALQIAVLAVIGSLVPLSGSLWPDAWTSTITPEIVAVIAFLPPFAAVGLALARRRNHAQMA